jgi:hypothetical protein
MVMTSSIRLCVCTSLTAFLVALAAPARAQFMPRPLISPASPETYHVEATIGLWNPTSDIAVSSESLGIAGTTIDAKQDLGLTDHRFPEFHLVLRPFKKHKLRLQYIPIKYNQDATLARTIVFNGQKYSVAQDVASTLDWKAWRFGYEYDFVSNDRGYLGFLLDVKYTDVNVTLTSPLTSEYTQARAPIPAIGGAARVYVRPKVSISGELSAFTVRWLPHSITKDYTGHYVDFDVYGTINLTNNAGMEIGYRSLDVGYLVPPDSGTFKLKGLWFGTSLRF